MTEQETNIPEQAPQNPEPEINIVPNVVQNENDNLTIGELLRKARLEKGIEFNQIYEAIKVRKAYVEALENNDFKALPNMLVARGYMKIYAELLGLDVTYFVSRFNMLFPEEATGSNGPRNPKESLTKFSFLIPICILVILWVRSKPIPAKRQICSN